ncbi:MAG: ABC transporter substrate-binding protein [Desulfuromonas sp.]|nr:MAG: ABC transporter substrate-binding protein [Desulfuromonas sp.]
MKKSVLLISLLSVFLLICAPAFAGADFPTKPKTNDGKKWRIGYLQGGDYSSYQKSVIAIVEGLMELGWIKPQSIPKQENDKETDKLWAWMSKSLSSDYIEFVADAYYDSDFNKEMRPKTKAALIERLNTKKDLDLIFALGTWAGQDMANDLHGTPTLVASTTDPLAAKIIKSVDDSGYDHIHAKVDPTRHERQVELFYDIFQFEKLGVAFEDSEEGRAFGAIDSVEKVAKDLDIQLVPCQADFNDLSQEQAEENIARCYKELAGKVDAVYIARHPGVSLKNFPNILGPLNKNKIPTFSQGLSDTVKHGVLLSISLADFSFIGDFYAKTIAKIFNGAKPRQLKQVFTNPPKIAINMKTAKIIGYNPPVDIVGAADEIFQEITVAK